MFNRKAPASSSRFPLGFIMGVCLIVGFLFGLVVGALDTQSSPAPKSVTDIVLPSRLPAEFQTDLYKKIWGRVTNKSIVKDVPPTELFYGSLKGLVAALGDPYSVFFDPEDTKLFQQELDGEFEGIGAEIGIKDDVLVIVAPLPGSPAEQAGLRAGDIILAIDKEPTFAMTLDQAVVKIRGQQGTPVTFVIRSRGSRVDRTVVVTRAAIIVPTVTQEMRSGVAIIRFYHFGAETVPVFLRIRDELLLQHPRGVIVDLRNNPGGLLEAAVEVAGSWVGSGKVVVKEVAGDGQTSEHVSRGSAELASLPTVVLVNGGSASASEILAGALQDYSLAKVVGEKTFGKGSVQEFEKFGDGSSLKLTIAKWLTPIGRDITKEGIVPDVIIEYSDQDFSKGQDPQLNKALELLKK